MLSLLLDKDFWLLIICVVAIGALIWAWVKFKAARVIISTIAVVVMCGFTTYAGFYINSYYSAEGGIYGQISNLFSPSFEIDVDDLKLSFDDIQLLQENDSDRYYAYLQTSQVLSIDNDTDYSICVNGKECDSVVTSDYISADFTLAFYNLANTEIMYVDTLHISISLNLNNTYTYVYTDNGLTCGSYWTQYFRNNGFVLTIVESTQTSTITFAEEDTDTLAYYRNLVASLSKQVTTLQEQLSQYEDTDSPTIAELESEIESLQADIATLKKLLESYADADEAVVYFYYDNELIASPIVTIGTKLSDIDVDVPESTDYIVFNGWTVNSDSVDSTYEITGTTTFVADLTYYYDVIFYVDNTAYSSQIVVENGNATAPVDPSKTGYAFGGWTLIESNDVVDISDYAITKTTYFHAYFTLGESYTTYADSLSFDFDDSTMTASVGAANSDVIVVDIPSFVSYEGNSYEVTWIYSNGFANCTELVSIAIEENITIFDYRAFYKCSSLSEVYYFGTAEQWANITLYGTYSSPCYYSRSLIIDGEELTVLNLYDSSITSISYNFAYIESITTIILPNSLIEIGYNAFSYCSSLETIWIPSSVTLFGYYATSAVAGNAYVNSPFYGCDTSLIIYCEATAESDDWGTYWNYCSSSGNASVKYGYSYAEYLSAIA